MKSAVIKLSIRGVVYCGSLITLKGCSESSVRMSSPRKSWLIALTGRYSAMATVTSLFGRPRETGGLIGSLGVAAEPSLYPEARCVLYQVLIRNATSQPIHNARIIPRVIKGNLVVNNIPKIIQKLNGNSSGTATFRLEPSAEVTFVEVECFMTFSREKKNASLQLILSPISFDFTLPQLMSVGISQEQWKERISRYFSDEESFVSTLSAERTLSTASKVLKDMGLAYTTRYKAENGFATERRDFFAVDSRGRGYGARMLWRFPHSKTTPPTLLVRLFAETEEGLFALCHRAIRRLNQGLNPKGWKDSTSSTRPG